MDTNSFLSQVVKADLFLLDRWNPDSPLGGVDLIMKAISSHYAWVVPLLIWILWSWKQSRQGWWKALLLMVVLIGLVDVITSQFLKPYFGRLRPCRLDDVVRVVEGCAGRFSFPSNHATNSMAFGFILFWWGRLKKVAYLGMLMSVLVGYSRVYLGVHYPSDVIVGLLWGCLWVTVISLVLQAKFPHIKQEIGKAFY